MAQTARGWKKTVHHIGTALGAQGLEVYATPSGIIYPAGTAGLVRTALLTMALAAGLGTVSALARVRQKALYG